MSKREVKIPVDILNVYMEAEGARELAERYADKLFGFKKSLKAMKEYRKLKAKAWSKLSKYAGGLANCKVLFPEGVYAQYESDKERGIDIVKGGTISVDNCNYIVSQIQFGPEVIILANKNKVGDKNYD